MKFGKYEIPDSFFSVVAGLVVRISVLLDECGAFLANFLDAGFSFAVFNGEFNVAGE